MVCFMFARLLSCVGCVASAFAWAPCRACGWAVAGLCLFSGPTSLWDGLVPSGPIWRLLGRFGALSDGLAPSEPIWLLLGRFGALGAGLGALWLGLWCSWLVSCLACGACGRLVRAWCAHGARMRGDVVFSRALPPPYKSGKKHKKEEILKIRFVGGNAAFLLQKSLLKETCAAAAKRRRRNGKRKGF